MDLPRSDSIPNPAVRRLSLYLRQLEEFQRQGQRTVSSRQLGESLKLTDAQVRKDLGYFGQFGRPGIGYRVQELIPQLRKILGTDHTWNVLLVGAGNLGRALCSYKGFAAKAFQLVAVFDKDRSKVGRKLGEFVIRPLGDLPATVREYHAKLAILAVPAEVAQDVADQLIEAGIRGILNFAPISLNVPRHVSVNAVDVAVQLEQLAFGVGTDSAEQ